MDSLTSHPLPTSFHAFLAPRLSVPLHPPRCCPRPSHCSKERLANPFLLSPMDIYSFGSTERDPSCLSKATLPPWCRLSVGRAPQRNESLRLEFQAGVTCWRKYFSLNHLPGVLDLHGLMDLWDLPLALGCFKASGLPLEEWQRPQTARTLIGLLCFVLILHGTGGR